MTNSDEFRDEMAENCGLEILAGVAEFGICLRSGRIGTRKPFDLKDLAAVVQASVRKALAAYQHDLNQDEWDGDYDLGFEDGRW